MADPERYGHICKRTQEVSVHLSLFVGQVKSHIEKKLMSAMCRLRLLFN
jgi:hypothetical protein